MVQSYIYVSQMFLAIAMVLGSQSLHLGDKHKWVVSIARYVIIAVTLRATKAITELLHKVVFRERDLHMNVFSKVGKHQFMIYLAAAAIVYLNNQTLYTEDLLLILVAYLIVKYPEIRTTNSVTIGTCLACSMIEGYLVYVIPTNGNENGFQDKQRVFESKHRIKFPVKRFFMIVTKSLFCPSDLKEFNDKSDREDVSRLEACPSLDEVVRDVAAVKNRIYKNSVYKIHRPNNQPPVYVTAECATNLYTLYKAIKNRHLSDELVGLKVDDIVCDFVYTLRSAVAKSPELKDKIEVVYFDDTDDSLNLSDVLLERIKKIEPDFEKYIRT